MNEFISIRKRKQHMKEIKFLEDVTWMEELVELRKLHASAWRESKPAHAPDLAQNWKQYFLWKTIAEVKISYY